MSIRKCENCEYYEEGINGERGDCHFNPPIIVQTLDKIYDEDLGCYLPNVEGFFPKVSTWDWCGKFKDRYGK